LVPFTLSPNQLLFDPQSCLWSTASLSPPGPMHYRGNFLEPCGHSVTSPGEEIHYVDS
jgi:hypothetical protein